MNGHEKRICTECGKIIFQCRCIEGSKNITYGVCDGCKRINTKKDLSGIIDTMVRDFAQVTPRPKSEVRRRIEELLESEREKFKEIVLTTECMYADEDDVRTWKKNIIEKLK